MKTVLISGLLALLTLGMISLATGQETNEQSCQQTIQNNCTKCHATKKICKKMDQANANWKEIVKSMGERGKLSQEVQDSVFTCLTTTPEPKKLVCDQ